MNDFSLISVISKKEDDNSSMSLLNINNLKSLNNNLSALDQLSKPYLPSINPTVYNINYDRNIHDNIRHRSNNYIKSPNYKSVSSYPQVPPLYPEQYTQNYNPYEPLLPNFNQQYRIQRSNSYQSGSPSYAPNNQVNHPDAYISNPSSYNPNSNQHNPNPYPSSNYNSYSSNPSYSSNNSRQKYHDVKNNANHSNQSNYVGSNPDKFDNALSIYLQTKNTCSLSNEMFEIFFAPAIITNIQRVNKSFNDFVFIFFEDRLDLEDALHYLNNQILNSHPVILKRRNKTSYQNTLTNQQSNFYSQPNYPHQNYPLSTPDLKPALISVKQSLPASIARSIDIKTLPCLPILPTQNLINNISNSPSLNFKASSNFNQEILKQPILIPQTSSKYENTTITQNNILNKDTPLIYDQSSRPIMPIKSFELDVVPFISKIEDESNLKKDSTYIFPPKSPQPSPKFENNYPISPKSERNKQSRSIESIVERPVVSGYHSHRQSFISEYSPCKKCGGSNHPTERCFGNRCFKCDEKGHKSENCPLKNSSGVKTEFNPSKYIHRSKSHDRYKHEHRSHHSRSHELLSSTMHSRSHERRKSKLYSRSPSRSNYKSDRHDYAKKDHNIPPRPIIVDTRGSNKDTKRKSFDSSSKDHYYFDNTSRNSERGRSRERPNRSRSRNFSRRDSVKKYRSRSYERSKDSRRTG